MGRIDQATITTTILCAPGWARFGRIDRNGADVAAHELARMIIERIGTDQRGASSPHQLLLAL
jgi:hypothetical protein